MIAAAGVIDGCCFVSAVVAVVVAAVAMLVMVVFAVSVAANAVMTAVPLGGECVGVTGGRGGGDCVGVSGVAVGGGVGCNFQDGYIERSEFTP